MASLLPRPQLPDTRSKYGPQRRVNDNPTVADSGMQIVLPSQPRKRIKGPRRDIQSVSDRAAETRRRAEVDDYWEREGVTKAAHEAQLANEADQMMALMNERHQAKEAQDIQQVIDRHGGVDTINSKIDMRNQRYQAPSMPAARKSPERPYDAEQGNPVRGALRKAGDVLVNLDEGIQSKMRMSPERVSESGIHGQLNWALTGGNPWSKDPDRYDNDLAGWAATAGARGLQAAGLTAAGAGLVGTTQALHDLVVAAPEFGSSADYQEHNQLDL